MGKKPTKGLSSPIPYCGDGSAVNRNIASIIFKNKGREAFDDDVFL